MANFRRDGAKERAWRERVGRFASSGLSVRAFCRRESITETSFYAWRRTLAKRDAAVAPAGGRPKRPPFVPMIVRSGARRDRGRIPASTQLSAAQPSIAITLELAGGRTLRLPETIAVERLAELVFALEARAVR